MLRDEIYKEIEESNALKVISRMEIYSDSFYTLSQNFKAIDSIIKEINSPENLANLLVKESDELTNHYLREIDRLLHNFVSSVKSLVDHQRVLINENYKNTELENIYKSRCKDVFIEDELVKFVQDLRNFIIHKGMPNTLLSIDIIRFVVSLQLPLIELNSFENWTALSKKFLKEQNSNINIHIVMNEYHEKCNDFHLWLVNEINKYHKTEFEELERLRDKLKSMD